MAEQEPQLGSIWVVGGALVLEHFVIVPLKNWLAKQDSTHRVYRWLLQKAQSMAAFVGQYMPWLVVGAGGVATLLGYVAQARNWFSPTLWAYLRINREVHWMGTLTVLVLTYLSRHRLAPEAATLAPMHRPWHPGNMLAKVFWDDFASDLHERWDFQGEWAITDQGVLRVGESDRGGIVKGGTDWQDYTMSFEGRIASKCLGVILRAKDPDNYCMLQITDKYVVPHLRRVPPPSDWGWHWKPLGKRPHHCDARGWFQASVVLRGQSVRLYIGGRKAFEDGGLLDIPRGSVGFRCGEHVGEKAEVRYVEVVLHS